MGWWNNDDSIYSSAGGDVGEFTGSSDLSGDRCATRRMVKSNCRTEEMEPGKFIRKCEKTEEIFKDCVGRPSEMVQSNKEYTEEDVTDQMLKGSFPAESSRHEPFDFPGLRSDIEAIERNFLGGISRFFEAAEEMKNGFFDVFGTPHARGGDSSPFFRQGIPIEEPPHREAPKTNPDGEFDLSGLAREI